MSVLNYRDLLIHYDYVIYSWVISTPTGEVIGSFTNIDKAKKFIDDLKN